MPNLLTFSLVFCLAFSSAGLAETPFTFQDQADEHLDVLRDGKILARYMYAYQPDGPRAKETTKPFLHVFDAEGKAPITNGEHGKLLPHHRGIFLGYNKLRVNGKEYDRWHMVNGAQAHRKFLSQKAGPGSASFTSEIEWTGAPGEAPALIEERTLTFLPAPAPAYALIDFSSKLKAVAGDTDLDGDLQHAGLHYRPAEELTTTQTVYFFPKENPQPGKDRDYPWVGESYTLNGQRYSVVYMNDPANPKGTPFSADRDYGRFGAFHKAKLSAGGSQTLHVRFLIVAGEMPPVENVQKAYNDFAGTHDPVPKMTAIPAPPSAFTKPKTPPDKPAPPKPAARLERGLPPIAEAPETGGSGGGKQRAGGGPKNPVLKFNLPPPPVLSPKEALKTFTLPPGFKIELVASEPMIEAPISMSWDDQGRAYVCEMRGYMNDMEGAGENLPVGRISRLEDTNGDGVFDKATVFVDKLVMPRGVMALGNGALVAEPPNLVWYHDTNGDGVADSHELVDAKFGQSKGQPEHMANSPTWLLDNWIRGASHGQRYRFQHGKFIQESTTPGGQWGLTQDDWGRPYFNYNSSLLHCDLAAAALYSRNPGLGAPSGLNWRLAKLGTVWPGHPTPGINRGYTSNALRDDGSFKSVTATCGPCIYRGDLFPEAFRGNAFIPEPAGNLVKRMILSEQGGVVAGHNASEGVEFLTSTDERFRPVNAYTGPDGALYIVDMGRGIIQHKAFLTDYLAANIVARKLEQPLNLGRIYRIVPVGAKLQPFKLPRETAAIIPLLAHANGWVRDTAQRVLVERAEPTSVAVIKKLAAEGATPQARLQALWTLEGLNALSPEVINARLEDKQAKVRAAAIRLADRNALPALLKLASDPDAEARVALAFKLSAEPGPAVQQALASLLKQGGSPLLAEAAASGLRGRELEFLGFLAKLPADADPKSAVASTASLLSGCVMKTRRAGSIEQLLDLAAAQPAGSPMQLALLQGMVGKEAAKETSLTYLARNPASLGQLQSASTGAAKTLVAAIDAKLGWPDKPGVPPPPVVEPLTADQQALFKQGQTLFSGICAGCHQPSGNGLENLAPPLAGSEWATGPADRLIRIVLHGLAGPVKVAGTNWDLEMPPLPLGDREIAAVLTYIRREWEHGASPVTPGEVAALRASLHDRSKPWSAQELAPAPTANKPRAAR